MTDKLMTPKELADRWAMNVGSLATMRSRGQGPMYIKVGAGARVRYRESDVIAYETARAHGASDAIFGEAA